LIYGCSCAPSERAHQAVNDSPEAETMSWEVSTTPVPVTGYKPTATMEVYSSKFTPEKMKALEDILYGKDAVVEPAAPATIPRMPLPNEVITLMGAA
jgi:hypothetical protein